MAYSQTAPAMTGVAGAETTFSGGGTTLGFGCVNLNGFDSVKTRSKLIVNSY